MGSINELIKEEAKRNIEEYKNKLHYGTKRFERIAVQNRVSWCARIAEAYKTLNDLENMIEWCKKTIHEAKKDAENVKKIKNPDYLSLYVVGLRKAYIMLAPYSFSAYCTALEWDFPAEQKFYANRICVMKEWVEELEKLEYGIYDILGLSAPPRSGKTGIGTIFLTWLAGRHNDKSMIFVTHTGRMAKKAFTDILNMLNDKRRRWNEIFPGFTIESSAEDLWVDIKPKNDPNNYKTIYFTSVDANKAGVMEASWLIYCDDLIGGIEEAMNPVRLDTAWVKYSTDVLQRKTGNVKILHIATRWSVRDPLSMVESQNEDNSKARFIKIPGLNEKGESNFNFPYNPLTKEHFESLKLAMDEVSFECIVQQNPIERDGLVFPESELSYYNGELPDKEPDEIVFSLDIAFGGGDFVSMPVGYVYGMDVYIHDVVHSDKTKEITRNLVANCIMENKCTRGYGEANNGGEEYVERVSNILKTNNYRCRIITKRAPVLKTKLQKILSAQSEIKGLITDGTGYRFLFLSPKARLGKPMYNIYMKHLTHFNQSAKFLGKQKDDAADATANLAIEVLGNTKLSGVMTAISALDLGI